MSKGLKMALREIGGGNVDIIDKLEKLMVFMCEKYEREAVFRRNGQGTWQLIRESGIDFGDAGSQLAAMDILRRQGLVEVVRPTTSVKILSSSRVRPTLRGFELVRDKKKSFVKREWPKVVSAVTEGIIKGLKG